MHLRLQKALLVHFPHIRLLVVAASDDKNKLELESSKPEDKQIKKNYFPKLVRKSSAFLKDKNVCGGKFEICVTNPIGFGWLEAHWGMIHSIQFSSRGQIFKLQQTNIYNQQARIQNVGIYWICAKQMF